MSTLNGRGQRTITAKTASYTITEADCGTTFTNAGASGAITFTLPAAAEGLWYRFGVRAAQELRIDPNGSETISLPSTGVPSAAGKYIGADAVGETVEIECCGGTNWAVRSYTGTWTAEA